MSEEEKQVKRFYKNVSVKNNNGCFIIQLDGRTAKTATGQLLGSKAQQLAEAVADEWAAQAEYIDKSSMPLTALLSISINVDDPVLWTNDILKYLKSDLICYRADTPAALVEQQNEIWDRYLKWARAELGAGLIKTTGLMSVDQPEIAVGAIANTLESERGEVLLAIKTLTEITGSAVIALSLWKDAFSPEDAFAASRLDEHFQAKRWGVDEEAAARETQLRKDFDAAVRFLRLAVA